MTQITPELEAMARAIVMDRSRRSGQGTANPWLNTIADLRVALLAVLSGVETCDGVPIVHSRQFIRELHAILGDAA
jgi:hypothetical protein